MAGNSTPSSAALLHNVTDIVAKRQRLAYIYVDSNGLIASLSSNISDYGFVDIKVGDEVEDAVDFMVGLDTEMELELPLIGSPAGIPVSVSLVPQESALLILIADASRMAEARQRLQQQANDNELLLYEQRRLMTQLEQVQAELKQKNSQLKEASQSQTRFISGVSHEFRTPLTSILGYTELLEKAVSEASASDQSVADHQLKIDSSLVAVQRSSRHLLSLVENLLDHGKLDAEELVIRPEAVALKDVVDDIRFIMLPLADAKGIKLRFTIPTSPASEIVVMDASRLRQCLINIVGNAVKFTDRGGVAVTIDWREDWLSVSVQDTGPGIGREQLTKIQLPFWQSDDHTKAGTGLGLTITARLLELMGSELRVESELGSGTLVQFELPAPSAPQAVKSDLAAPQSIVGLRFLLAEDDPDIALLLCHLLEHQGAQVVHVSNGALAVEAALAQDFDIVLMDLHMPVLNGYQAIEEFNAANYSTPIVVMSASSLVTDRSTAYELGCAGYLTKPVNIADIAQVVAEVLDSEGHDPSS